MKILFYIENFRCIGGAENYAVSICRELSIRGHEVHVVCKQGEKIENIFIHKEFVNIKGVLKALNPDISFDWGLFERADISRLGGGIHEIYIRYAIYSYPFFIRPFRLFLYNIGRHKRKKYHQQYVLSCPNTIYITPSKFIKNHALRYGISYKRIKLLYNGVNLIKFFPEDIKTKKRKRQEWGIKDNDIVFLFVAHNLRLKNFSLLKKIFDDLYYHYGYSNIKLIVAGKKTPNIYRPYLICTGFVQNIREIYAISDVLLHPSFFDTFGSVVLEAMACGLPVLVSNFTGSSEIVGTGGRIIPVIGKNVKNMWSNKVKEMFDRDIRLNMGANARAIAEKYDFFYYVNEIEKLLKQKIESSIL